MMNNPISSQHSAPSVNVSKKIGKKFLRIIDKNFPPLNPLHNIFNRNTVKMSYRCNPNLATTISAHNSKILKPKQQEKTKIATVEKKMSAQLGEIACQET